MRIKVFKAADLKEAMAMVKDELGGDAVILHTKRYKQGGFLGYKSKEVVEVTAAVDDTPRRARGARSAAAPRVKRQTPPAPETKPAPVRLAARPRQVLAQYKTAGTEAGVSLAGAAERVRPRRPAPVPPPPAEAFTPLAPEPILRAAPTVQPVRRRSKPRPARAALTQELAPETAREERSSRPAPPARQEPVLRESPVLRETPVPQEAAAPAPPPAVREEPARETAVPSAPPASAVPAAETREPAPEIGAGTGGTPREQEKIHALEDELAQMRQMLRQVMSQSASGDAPATLKDALKAQELRDDVMQDMIRKIPPATMMLEKSDPEAVKALGDYLHSVLRTGDGIGLRDGRPKIVALIGTTGVGKTTTIAKIAAKFVLERGISVALITADTYRISAVDQLRTYSDIIGLPLEIVYSPAELVPALRKHRNKKLILIDTAGRSQNNEYQMDELKEFLAAEPSIEKHLVLSATTKERDAEAIIERFSVCRPDRILLTKTDETESVGFIVNLLYDRRLALSYLTTGQSVPDDIEPAKPEVLARLMLR